MSHPGNFSERPNKGQGAQDLARGIVSSLGIQPASDSEHVRILREALEKAKNALNAAACYFDKQDEPVVVNQVEEALEEASAAIKATKEGS